MAHDCPSGVPIPGVTFDQGRRFFPEHLLLDAEEHRKMYREIVDETNPAVYVHGHYHRFYGHIDRQTGTRYIGLDMDSTSMDKNLWIVETPIELERSTDDRQRSDRDSGDDLHLESGVPRKSDPSLVDED